CNPYLTFAAILTAGLEGVERGYPDVPPTETDVYAMSDEERAAEGIETLPDSLYEALRLAEGSTLLRKALGEHTFKSLLQNKRIEWERYRAAVTDFELKRYLPIL
ncbi:MAG: glutamine synthetase, partial [Dehalococcoidia bacterium]